MPHVVGGNGLETLRNQVRRDTVQRARVPWRTRRTSIKLTPQEKADRAKVRFEKSTRLNQKLAAAHDVIWKLADELAGEFPGHNADYYFRHLIQQSGRKKAARGDPRWNAFVSTETLRRNEGACFVLAYNPLLLMLWWQPVNRRRALMPRACVSRTRPSWPSSKQCGRQCPRKRRLQRPWNEWPNWRSARRIARGRSIMLGSRSAQTP